MPDSSVVAPDPDFSDLPGSDDEPAGAGRPRPSRTRLTLVAIPIIGLIVLSNVGDALAPDLVNSHPLRLLAMNARNRNLILVTNNLDAASYYIVGTLRLLLADPLFFLLGHWYGDTAITWMERRTKSFGTTLRQMEGWFGKAAYPIVFIAPNQYICPFAGAAGMSVAGFFAANLAGTVVRLYLIRRLGEAFEAPIDDLLGWIRDYRTPLLVISIALFAVIMINELRRQRSGLEELAEAAEHEADGGVDGGVDQADGSTTE
jgi:membrane protein DedA with SNARE-associated domain